MHLQSRVFALIALMAACGLLAPTLAQEAEVPETAQLAVTAIRVEPANPAADTLCRLTVELENTGDRIATQLGFTVTINGRKLPVYESHLFMYPLAPGAKSELALFNFWSTETSRPEPANGKLEIEVTLREARWMKIDTEGDVETWTPLGDVAALPVGRAITVPMSKKSGG